MGLFKNNSQPKVTNVSAGGISTRGNKSITATSSPERQALVGNIAKTFAPQAQAYANLRSQVTPGFGRLTTSRLAGVENNRRRTVGDLRENLARRRVLGSSFAQDALTRANLEFQQESDRVNSESFLQELALSQELVGQEFAAARGQFQTLLDELNIQLDVASGVASEANASARQQAQLDAQASSGTGALVGKLIGTAASALLAPATGGASLAAIPVY